MGNITAEGFVPDRLSTPVSYITTAKLPDVFVNKGAVVSNPNPIYFTLFYQNVHTSINASRGLISREYLTQVPPATTVQSIKSVLGWNDDNWRNVYGMYKLGSIGPDQDYNGGANIYDATNGTVSSGDIYRTTVRAEGGGI